MNVATFVSLTACLVGISFVVMTLAIAPAPGTPGLRFFSLACLFGALYAATNATLATSWFELSRVAVPLGVLLCGLHGASWYLYSARRERRGLRRYERFFVGGCLGFGVLALVPDLLYESSDPWLHSVPALGITYLDARSTSLGDAAFAFFVCAMAVLLGRSLRGFRTAGRIQRAEAVGLSALVATGTNDALAAADVVASPYLLDLGFLSLVTVVGGALARRFVENARDLQAAHTELVLRERLAALGEMSAVVAHEVRNPVAVILNAAAAMRRNPDERDRLLGIVEEEAGRLTQMVTDLLAFARPTSVRLAEEPLAPIIQSALDAVRQGSGKTAVDVDVDLDERLPPVLCDVHLLRQAIVNLVTNAIQAPDRKSPVRVMATMTDEPGVRLEVIDDGAGVDAADAERIFRPFFTTRPTGTGLGLAVVQRVVEAHGGKLLHRVTPGGGATFEVDLPLHPAT